MEAQAQGAAGAAQLREVDARQRARGGRDQDAYPDSWRQGKLTFRVTYQFEPGADADGVTVHIPLQVLNQVTAEGFDWQIPGCARTW
ncbi:DUF3418 domain-containing protein [Streptomyces sp. M19]